MGAAGSGRRLRRDGSGEPADFVCRKQSGSGNPDPGDGLCDDCGGSGSSHAGMQSHNNHRSRIIFRTAETARKISGSTEFPHSPQYKSKVIVQKCKANADKNNPHISVHKIINFRGRL